MEQVVPPAPPQPEADNGGSQTQRGNRTRENPPTSSTAAGIQELEPGNSSPTPSTSTDPAFLSREPEVAKKPNPKTGAKKEPAKGKKNRGGGGGKSKKENMATASPNSGAMPASKDDSGPLPFTPEYQLIPEGGSTNQAFKDCIKNPEHPTFIPVEDFRMEHIPEVWRTDKVMEFIKLVFDSTVRVVVGYVSLDRPDNYLNYDIRGKKCRLYGTGFVHGYDIKRVANERCPCRECKTSGDPKMDYLEVKVATAKHVVFDTSEAEHTTIEFYYDSDDRSSVITFDCVRVEWDDFHLDKSQLVCVNHDMDVYGKVSRIRNLDFFYGLDIPFMASHPHGVSKRISIGSFYNYIRKIEIPTDEPFTFKVGQHSKCRLRKDHRATSLESFQDLVDSNTACQPGVVYGVREGVEMSCNPSTCWICRDQCDEDRHTYVRFPSDVEFKFVNGTDSKSFPDVEFRLDEDEWDLLMRKKVAWHKEYDTPTCPGSSGAMPGGWWYSMDWPHAGYDGVNGVSRTGRMIRKKR